MPGPARVHGPNLIAALADGSVGESDLDAVVRDLLVLALRTKAGERSAAAPEVSVDDPSGRRLAREVAIAGTVLARNNGVLPLDPDSNPRIAVIGPNAKLTRIMGGGSSAVKPLAHTSILDALTDRFGSVTYETGWNIDKYTPLPRADQLIGPDGEPGVSFRFVNGPDLSAAPVYTGRSDTTSLRYLGSFPDGVDPMSATMILEGSFVPDIDGPHEIGVVVTGSAHVAIGGRSVIELEDFLPKSQAFYGYGSTEQRVSLELRAGEPVSIEVELPLVRAFCGVRIGFAEPIPANQFERAVAAAGDADIAIIVAGTNDDHETEGNDRTSMSLPGRQDELIAAAAAVSKRVAVVVNAGSPVSMPWLDQVDAVLLPFFGGMEVGEAVADIITGRADPGGRLPITFPKQLEDCPAWPHYAPVDGVQTYGEGFGMGYRGHDRSGVEPLLPFGHGLSYGSVEWGDARVTGTTPGVGGDGGVITVVQTLTGTGERPATVVVQGYVAPVDPPVDREPKALKVWRKLVVAPGERVEVELSFGGDAFRRWSIENNDWTIDPGRYQILLAESANAIHSTLDVDINPPAL
ncbi:MAG: glycoside hydrolase family 3 C-terminal domain-containing protein [Acidimicrobiales bacterium]